MPHTPPEIVAAVDLGSNSFHMIVCSLNNGNLQTIDRLKEMVRLASGLDKNNVLDLATQARALACLERFGQRVRNFPAGSVRVVGTNTLRTAKNAQEFLIKAEQALGHPIHVIAGIEEARLIYLGVIHSLGISQKPRLVMDIGGGSTEYIIGTANSPQDKESLHMGCVSVSELFFKNGVLSKKAFAQATLYAQQKLEPFTQKFHRANWHEAIGASGSLRSIARVLHAKNWSNNGITRLGLEQLVNHVQQCNHSSELNLPELEPERLPIFTGGLAIVYATFNSLHIEQMTVADGALREGLILDLLGRLSDHDSRAQTVDALARRYHTDTAHAQRIKNTIAAMLNQLQPRFAWAGDENKQKFLYWAADLHEIGNDIAHSQYHKHSGYIIEYGDLAGFSRQDQILLATLIRAHRRKFTRACFSHLPAPWHEDAPYLAIILRLAVLLHRNRHEDFLPEFSINLLRTKIQLSFPPLWLTQAPLTYADLQQEADYLKSVRIKLEFS